MPAIMFQPRNGPAGHLGRIVPAPYRDGRAEPRLLLEAPHLVGGERPALKAQAEAGGWGQPGVIVRFDGTQVTLGGDVQANGIDDGRPEMPLQPGGATL